MTKGAEEAGKKTVDYVAENHEELLEQAKAQGEEIQAQIGEQTEAAKAAIDEKKQQAQDEIDARKKQAQEELDESKARAQKAMEDAKDVSCRSVLSLVRLAHVVLVELLRQSLQVLRIDVGRQWPDVSQLVAYSRDCGVIEWNARRAKHIFGLCCVCERQKRKRVAWRT